MRPLLTTLLILLGSFSFAQNDSILPNEYGKYTLKMEFPFVGQEWIDVFEFFPLTGADDTLIVIGPTASWPSQDTIAFIALTGSEAHIKRTLDPTGTPYFDYWDDYMGDDWELLYKYDVNIGDTLYQFQLASGMDCVVEFIDTINVLGVQRKRIVNSCGDEWIQGMGSVLHPLQPTILYFEIGHQLCAAELHFNGSSPINNFNYDGYCYASLPDQIKTTHKDLVKVVDLMGRETEIKPNTVLLYVYSDGTTEKMFRFE